MTVDPTIAGLLAVIMSALTAVAAYIRSRILKSDAEQAARIQALEKRLDSMEAELRAERRALSLHQGFRLAIVSMASHNDSSIPAETVKRLDDMLTEQLESDS